MGKNDLREMEAGQMDPAGRSLTNAGRICGIIGCVLLVLGVLIAGLIFVMGMMGAIAGAR